MAFVVASAPDTGGTYPYLVYVDDYFNGKVRELSRAGASEPDWGPDGRQIVYSYAKGNRSTVRILDLRRQRTWFVHEGSHPRWSPDGRQIVFANGGQIHVMNADGSNVRQLTH